MFNKEETLLFELDKNNWVLKVSQKNNKDDFLSIKLYKSDRKNLFDYDEQDPFSAYFCSIDFWKKTKNTTFEDFHLSYEILDDICKSIDSLIKFGTSGKFESPNFSICKIFPCGNNYKLKFQGNNEFKKCGKNDLISLRKNIRKLLDCGFYNEIRHKTTFKEMPLDFQNPLNAHLIVNNIILKVPESHGDINHRVVFNSYISCGDNIYVRYLENGLIKHMAGEITYFNSGILAIHSNRTIPNTNENTIFVDIDSILSIQRDMFNISTKEDIAFVDYIKKELFRLNNIKFDFEKFPTKYLQRKYTNDIVFNCKDILTNFLIKEGENGYEIYLEDKVSRVERAIKQVKESL